MSFGLFLLISTGARLFRFLIVTGTAWLISCTLLAKLTATTQLRIHAAGWAMFYLVYFWRMGG